MASKSDFSFERHRLLNVAGAVTLIEWVLLVLGVLSLMFGGVDSYDRLAISTGSMFYAALVLAARHARLLDTSSSRTVALETWAMTAFVTWVAWYTGRLASPVLNAYLLVMVASALSLGTGTLLLQLMAIAGCYVALGENLSVDALLSPSYVLSLLTQLTPLIVIAYMASIFAAEIRYGIGMARLAAEKDELTGVYNMRGFAVIADRLFAQASRYGLPLSIVVVRVDDLEAVTAGAGGEAASKLLMALADRVRGQLRHNDVLARRAQDLFVVLAPETPAAGAADLAERIRAAGMSLSSEVLGRSGAWRLSVGISSYSERGHSIDALVAIADRALNDVRDPGRR